MLKHLPNLLTCLNLTSGCVGLVLALDNSLFIFDSLPLACICIYLGAFFDFLDGFAARLLKVSSPIGKELDSLADMVTFGALPAAILYALFSNLSLSFSSDWIYLSPLLVAIFSALRLAKFNVDTRQTSSFIGVPTPANAIFISSLPFIYDQYELPAFFYHPLFLVGLVGLLSYLLVSEIPLFALKFKSYGWKENRFKYLLIVSSVFLLAFLQFLAIPFIFIAYILLSLLESKLST